MNLTASMVARNEIGRYMPIVIADLRRWCDTIVVYDDASDDGTREWLLDQKDDQLHVIRGATPSFDKHEGHLRQLLLDLTLTQKPTHVLNVDCDEIIDDGLALRATVDADLTTDVWTLTIAEAWNARPDRLEIRAGGGWRPHPLPLLWKVNPKVHYRIRDRKLACQRFPQEIATLKARRSTGRTVFHFGWADASDRQRRFDRYMRLDGGAFHALSHLRSILWDDERVGLQAQEWPDSPWVPSMKERLGCPTV